jgi:hypothetical protein
MQQSLPTPEDRIMFSSHKLKSKILVTNQAWDKVFKMALKQN